MTGQQPHSRGERVLALTTPVAATGVLLLSAAALIIWLAGGLDAVRLEAGYAAMAPLTATCFLLLSGVILYRRSRRYAAGRVITLYLVATLVIALGAFTLADFLYVSLADIRYESQSWLMEKLISSGGYNMGRMSPLTGALLVVLAVATILSWPFSSAKPRRYALAQGSAAAVLATACLLLVGYWYGSPLLYGGSVTPVALTTAAGFFIMSLALLCESPRAWVRRWFLSGSVAARFTRLIVPASVLGILIAGWVHQKVQLVSDPFDFSLTALVTAGAVTLIIVLAARRTQKAIDAGERSLRERQEFAEGLIGSLQDGLSVIGPDGKRMMVNQALVDMTGFSREELNAGPPFAYWPPEHREELGREFARMSRGELGESEFIFMRKNGERFPALLTPSYIRDDKGGFVAQSASIKDISERKRAEEALRASEGLLRRSQEIAHLGSWGLDLVKNELTWSEEAYRIFGTEPQRFAATYEAFLDAVHPDDRESVDEAYTASLREGRDSYEVVHRIIRRDNGEERTVHEKCEHYRDESGEIVRSVGMVHDITEQVAAEKTIMQQNRDLAALLGIAESLTASLDMELVLRNVVEGAVGLAGLDSGAVYLLQGDELYLGATTPPLPEGFPEELRQTRLGDHPHIGRAVSSGEIVILPDAADAKLTVAERAAVEERSLCSIIYLPLIVETRAVGVLILGSVDVTHEYTPVEINMLGTLAGQAALTIENARLYGAVEQELAERKQAEKEREKLREQLTQSQKMESVGRLAGGVAHDFNNMLGVIIGHAEMAREHVDADDPISDDLDAISKAARRSTDLTRQLLAFARKQATSPRVLMLDETITGMLGMLQRLIGEEIALEFIAEDGLWPVRIDPSQVDQVLANLTVNARDAISGAGTVRISLGNIDIDEALAAASEGLLPGEYVELVVSDDGSGMDDDILEHLFEPFFTTKGMTEGTGLGMATVYGIVKQNQGYVDVESEPDKGTSVRILLPRFRGRESEARVHHKVEAARGDGETVLLVEDEPTVLHMAAVMLEKLGYRVLRAASPQEALELARQRGTEVRLLLTDVIMPGMSGRQLADQVTEIAPHIEYIFMSGYTDQIIAEHGVLEDEVRFIQKPFDAAALAVKLREALDS